MRALWFLLLAAICLGASFVIEGWWWTVGLGLVAGALLHESWKEANE
jgi:hypothetical protein